MVRIFDAIVVGAGPIGGYLSKKLNEHGHSAVSYTHLTLPTTPYV